MMSNRNMQAVKRIGFAAGDINRKAMIEWLYYNQQSLQQHNLIASGAMADLLEGTVGVPVTRLHDSAAAANHELLSLVNDQQLDILFFLAEGNAALPHGAIVQRLHAAAIENNIIMASNLATAEFILSSPFMLQPHAVPLHLNGLPRGHQVGYLDRHERRVQLKVNSIH